MARASRIAESLPAYPCLSVGRDGQVVSAKKHLPDFSSPFGKARLGGILQINAVTIMELLIDDASLSLL